MQHTQTRWRLHKLTLGILADNRHGRHKLKNTYERDVTPDIRALPRYRACAFCCMTTRFMHFTHLEIMQNKHKRMVLLQKLIQNVFLTLHGTT
jgi:hypothetical protein